MLLFTQRKVRKARLCARTGFVTPTTIVVVALILLILVAIESYVTIVVEPRHLRETQSFQHLSADDIREIELAPARSLSLLHRTVQINDRATIELIFDAVRKGTPVRANHHSDNWRCGTRLLTKSREWTALLAGTSDNSVLVYLDGGLTLKVPGLSTSIERLARNTSQTDS
jgi:hypothetical protein